jgi:hypothetical protein
LQEYFELLVALQDNMREYEELQVRSSFYRPATPRRASLRLACFARPCVVLL